MAKPAPQIAIVTDDPGWHGEQLRLALARHGLSSHFFSLTECRLTLTNNDEPVYLPGFGYQRPLGVFVRGIPGGSLDQVIFRLDVLHMLVELGVVVYNAPRAIERTVDKGMTSFLLRRAGLPTPETWVFESREEAEAICHRAFSQGQKLVLKPLFGSQGIGVQLVDRDSGIVPDEKFTGLYYLQAYVERNQPGWFDIRVFVIDGQARAAMRRHGQIWITNRAQGARCESLPLDERLRDLAENAVRVIDIDYGGVDLIPDAGGQLQVIEVNGIPAWRGLQEVTEFNIANCLIDHFVRRIGDSHVLTVLP